MKKTVVAVIGCGTIANNAHIPAYVKNPDVEIKWFCDIIPERADAAVEKYGCGKAVYDYREILDDPEIDGVSICAPNNVHAQITIDFLNAGKNVLCEKPAARTYDEALTMLEAQHKTGKVLNIGVVNRFNDSVNQIKKRIDAGELGEIYQIYMSFRAYRDIPGLGGAYTTKEIAGGGVLIDWGVHFLDIVMYCCKDPKPITVTAETHCKLAKNINDYKYRYMWAGPPKLDGVCDVEEFVTGMIRTEGPTITFNGAWAQNIDQREMFIDFLGTKGGVRLKYGGDFTLYDSELNAVVPEYPSNNHFENELNAFVECIHSGEKLPSHIDTNITSSKIMQAIYDSAESRREIAFE